MRQALHILRKDLRRLWPVALVPVAFKMLQLMKLKDPDLIYFTGTSLQFFDPFSSAFLIAIVIHSEPLVGDREFWLTRPYQRASLLGAKALFIFLTTVVPFIVTDCIILASGGMPLLENAPGMLLRHFSRTVIILLPFSALAAVTRNLVEFILLAIGAIFALSTMTTMFRPDGSYSISDIFIPLSFGVFGAAVILLQYRWRKTLLSEFCIAAAILLPSPHVSWETGLRIRTALDPFLATATRLTLPAGGTPRGGVPTRPGYTQFLIPIRVDGLAKGITVRASRAFAEVTPAPGHLITPDATLMPSINPTSLFLEVTDQHYKDIVGKPIDIHLRAYFTVMETVTRARIPAVGRTQIPGYGFCEGGFQDLWYYASCQIPIWNRTKEATVTVIGRGQPFPPARSNIRASVWPFYMSGSFDPRDMGPVVMGVNNTRDTIAGKELAVTIDEPIGRVRLDLKITGIHLAARE